MPLTTALYTGMSGLSVNQTALDVIGNNIANVNTTAFKGARALFQPEFSETYSFGTPPGDTFGGSNPSQKGLGVRVGRIQRDFASGNIKLTGVSTDVAIDGEGMFVVEDSERFFTRTGHFMLNSDNYLATPDGRYVMGYAVDTNYNIVQGTLTRIRIPMNKITVARATSTAVMDGQLGGDELTAATLGTILESGDLTDVNGVGGEMTAASLLVDLEWHDPNQAGAPGEQRFFDGTTLSFEGARGEGRLQGPRTMAVDTTTTVQDLMDFMVDAFGIHTDPTLTPPGGQQAGATIVQDSATTWAIQIIGNVGEENAIQMGTGGLRSDYPSVPGPLTFEQTQEAVGTSLFTSFDAYDSLGNPVKIDLTFVFESEDNLGRTWRFFANSIDDTDVSTALGSGTISFDVEGKYLDSTGTAISIDRDSTGTVTPLAITLDLSRIGGIVKDGEATVQLATQDGEAAGTLTEFSISQDGSILGAFTNGATRALGQLALATFSNYAGLVDAGENVYKVGPNSGEAIIGQPLANGAGQIFGGAIETSNVDISREFIDMIIASTGFSASSRVITTSNQLLTELLSIVR